MGRRRGPSNAEKQETLQEAAALLLGERGGQVTLAEICRRAGVSRQTVYNRYGSKHAFFEAVAARRLEPCPCCPDDAGDPPEILLSRYAATLLRWAYTTRHVTALRACGRGADTWDAVGFDVRAPAQRKLAAMLRQETRRGRLNVADPEGAAALVLDLVLSGPQLRLVLSARSQASPAQIEGLSTRCARLFVRGCSDPRLHPPSPRERPRAPTLRAAEANPPPAP